jgi:hypothetical protein
MVKTNPFGALVAVGLLVLIPRRRSRDLHDRSYWKDALPSHQQHFA